MNKLLLLVLLSFLLNFNLFGQTEQKENTKPSINEQFETLYKESSTYQEYKVVKQTWLRDFQTNVNDSLKITKAAQLLATTKLQKSEQELDSLKTNINKLQVSFDSLNNEKQQISFFGISMVKNSFQTLMYSLLFIMILLVLFIYVKFKKSNTVTVLVEKNLKELEEEFTNYKQRAIEREQQLGRQLQDEINKHKKK